MAETLYVVLKNGSWSAITGVTAFAIDNTLTIKPGDFYRNIWTEQDNINPALNSVAGVTFTRELGDAVTPAVLKTESWLCSHWKFTRGASLPIIRIPWIQVEAVCSDRPNTVVTGATYVTLRSGVIAPIVGVTGTTGITPNTSLTVYPGDYYRNTYLQQTNLDRNGLAVAGMVWTNQMGDATTNTALNAETWDASHYEFTRSGLLTLYIPWINALAISDTYPNRAAA